MTKDTETTDKKPETVTAKASKQANFNIGRIFWGLLLVLVGGLILANNFGLVNVSWVNLWQLWPLLIIVAGLSVLSFNSWVWNIVSILLIILIFGAITWAAIGSGSGTDPFCVNKTTIEEIFK